MFVVDRRPPSEWASPASLPTLGRDDIHVWRADLDLPSASLAPLEATLVDEERQRAARYRFPAHRNRWVAARGILRQIVSGYLCIDPAEVRFDYGAYGKPTVRGVGEDGLCFSLTHAERMALYAVTLGRRVGIDLEVPRQDLDIDGIAARQFSAAEAAAHAAQPVGQRLDGFFRCWTRKEAYVKALGLGLSRPLDRFTVSLGPEPALLADADDPRAPERWSFHAPDPGLGYVAALAVESKLCRFSCWGWSPETRG